VITVADEPNQLSALRRELVPLLHLPGSSSAGDLAHLTLFRYARPLRDPRSLLEWLAATEFSLDIDVSELLVVPAPIFPSHPPAHTPRHPSLPPPPPPREQPAASPGQRSRRHPPR